MMVTSGDEHRGGDACVQILSVHPYKMMMKMMMILYPLGKMATGPLHTIICRYDIMQISNNTMTTATTNEDDACIACCG